MRLEITTKDDKKVTLDVTPAVECVAESEWKEGFYKRLSESQRQADLYWVAHQCMKRKGLTQLEFGDAFLETLQEVEIITDAPNG